MMYTLFLYKHCVFQGQPRYANKIPRISFTLCLQYAKMKILAI